MTLYPSKSKERTRSSKIGCCNKKSVTESLIGNSAVDVRQNMCLQTLFPVPFLSLFQSIITVSVSVSHK